MKLSTKTRYGLRLMIDLAGHYGCGSVALKDVAKRQDISKKYLEQVVSPLVSAGLLCVSRGYLGGYALARTPEKITCADIVSATEDGLCLLDCTSGKVVCDRADSCLSQYVWRGLEENLRSYLANITLQDILEHESAASTYVI